MEGEIGKMTADLSYRLSGMMVREFRGKKFLSTSKEYSQIEEIKDIGDVEDEGSDEDIDQGHTAQLDDARVVGILHLNMYKFTGCLRCSAKVLPDKDNAELGHCMKCSMMQCLDASTVEFSAQLVVQGVGSQLTLVVQGVGSQLTLVVQGVGSQLTLVVQGVGSQLTL